MEMKSARRILTTIVWLFLLTGLLAQQGLMKSPDVFIVSFEGEYNQVDELNIALDEHPGIIIINNVLINGKRFWQKNSNKVTAGSDNCVFWFYDGDRKVLELKFGQAIDIKTVELSLITANHISNKSPVSSITGNNSSKKSLTIDQFNIEREQ